MPHCFILRISLKILAIQKLNLKKSIIYAIVAKSKVLRFFPCDFQCDVLFLRDVNEWFNKNECAECMLPCLN